MYEQFNFIFQLLRSKCRGDLKVKLLQSSYQPVNDLLLQTAYVRIKVILPRLNEKYKPNFILETKQRRMKLNRIKIFIAISSVALITVLGIQINWILQIANNKETLFNEKANIVLARTTEALSADKDIFKNSEIGLDKHDSLKTDSLLQHYMKYYNFHTDYTFEVIKPLRYIQLGTNDALTDSSFTNNDEEACYTKSLDSLLNKNGWKLQLNFPEKNKFIRAEMRAPFIASVILIIIVLVLFWRTVLTLLTEKKIAEHTTDFLNNMTHEFKTPLTNIALAGKMIIKETTPENADADSKHENKIKHYSGIILEENDKLRLQVEQVLSLTALERGEIPLQKTELDFHQLIQNCLKSTAIQIESSGGELKLKLQAEKFVVNGDKTNLANALSNLIENAIKYSGEKPEVTIETYNSDENIITVVADKGIGIEKQYQKKVFEKYFRVPTGNVHDVKGFGLGLAYVKKIIELHDGTIKLESETGSGMHENAHIKSGTAFIISLPNA